jgi:hypothetical protein
VHIDRRSDDSAASSSSSVFGSILPKFLGVLGGLAVDSLSLIASTAAESLTRRFADVA